LLLLLLLAWIYSLRKKLRRERGPKGTGGAIASEAAGSGQTPNLASQNLINSGGMSMSQQPSLPSTDPTPSTGPSPSELQERNYAPWATHASPPPLLGAQQPYQQAQTYQQAPLGQTWQQAQGPGQTSPAHNMTAMPETYDEGFIDGYREVDGVETGVYETSANLPRPGISRMPDGRIYTEPVEIGGGQSEAPRVT
jgi:hypothetical protein